MHWNVAALYHFARVDNPPREAEALRTAMAANEACGTLILAPEGINGTIAAPSRPQLDAVLETIRAMTGFANIEVKFSTAAGKPFGKMKVKLKPEIVTLRQTGVDPTTQVGTYVEGEDWNRLLEDPDVVVIDTRNTYEYEIGTFKGAIDPKTNIFCEFPEYVTKHLDPARHKKIAMFCTGGIRCEKASSYMLSRGFETVFHLKGGILKYLETMPEDKSMWDGKCFVFDEREALAHGLKEAKRID